jgi:hypothetical protein
VKKRKFLVPVAVTLAGLATQVVAPPAESGAQSPDGPDHQGGMEHVGGFAESDIAKRLRQPLHALSASSAFANAVLASHASHSSHASHASHSSHVSGSGTVSSGSGSGAVSGTSTGSGSTSSPSNGTSGTATSPSPSSAAPLPHTGSNEAERDAAIGLAVLLAGAFLTWRARPAFAQIFGGPEVIPMERIEKAHALLGWSDSWTDHLGKKRSQ